MPHDAIYPSVLDAIGNTPMVELSRVTGGLEGRVFAKLEFLNPGYSKKDRIARQLIEEAEADGALKTGDTVVELTSGNTGTGLAIVCAAKGYRFVAVMSRGNSIERARMMAALGAEVALVDQCPESTPGQVSGADLARVEAKAQEIVRERRAFRADQFQLAGNARAHYHHTAPEMLTQSGGIDAFCDYIGSGGSFAGCARYFKERDPAIQCYIVEPTGAAVYAGETVSRPNHKIQGGGYAMRDLALVDRALIDGCLQVSDEEAAEMTRRLASEEGLFAGYSSGANLAAAAQLLRGPHRGGRIAILLPDSGLKYLSTTYGRDKMSAPKPQGDIIRWMRRHHDSLSPSQRKVSRFLLEGGIGVIHLTITEIAADVGVNPSTVVRTAQALGFEGFPELQSGLRGQFLNQAKIAQRMHIGSQQLLEELSAADQEDAHLLTTVLRDEVQTLLDLPQHVPTHTFDQAVDMVDQAGHVYIIGLGSSFPLALNFGIVLRYIRPDTTVLTPGIDPIAAQMTPLKEGDLILSLCFARYTRETLTAMDVGRQRGAAVLTVTDSHVSPAATRSDLALIVPYRLRLYSNTVALFALLDAILGALSLRYPEKTRERLESLEELYQQFNLLALDG